MKPPSVLVNLEDRNTCYCCLVSFLDDAVISELTAHESKLATYYFNITLLSNGLGGNSCDHEDITVLYVYELEKD